MQKQYLACPKCGETLKVDRRATGKAAKVHGGGFEHRVAKELEKLTQLKWKKVPASGGLHIPGDVFCLSYKEMPFVIECKNTDGITVNRIFKEPEFLLRADGGAPLVTPDQVAVINNLGQSVVIMAASLYVIGGKPLTDAFATFEVQGELYIMGPLKLLAPVLISHKEMEDSE